jgi:hypothetical protein
MSDRAGLPTAYGLSWRGLDDERHLLGAPEPSFPVVSVEFIDPGELAPTAPDPGEDEEDDYRLRKRLLSGHVLTADRVTRTATIAGPPLLSDERVHPALAQVAGIHGRWLGRELFHGGVFAHGGRAWVVSGPREAGKSSLLATLSARGHAVLADDVTVVDGTTVFAGPRCLDLRGTVPGVSADAASVRGGTRLRVLVPPAMASLPLGGWLFLRWGERVKVSPVPPPRLLRMLARRRHRPAVGSDLGQLLAFCGHPAWVVERPQDWNHADVALSAVLDAVSGAAPLSR